MKKLTMKNYHESAKFGRSLETVHLALKGKAPFVESLEETEVYTESL